MSADILEQVSECASLPRLTWHPFFGGGGGMKADDLLCSRNARPQMDAKEQADRSSCSQSPHDKAVVARCAQ